MIPGAARARLLALAWLLLASAAAAAPPGMERSLERIRHEWALAAFELPPERRVAALEILAEMARRVAERFPGEVQPQVWEGIILASLADNRGAVAGYFTAHSARELLQAAESRQPSALDGPGYAALGLLYGSAPGWPFSFGDPATARAYFEKAVATAPESMETHYFYGGFLLRQGESAAAARHLRQALREPIRSDPGDPAAHGRREVRRDLARAEGRP
ncbi:MAG TPA: tetratricopeptide repeat protein [Burkholderiales bacterium]|nr:tetratricopeptide repeat protein [Burkholderiales bacterium]